MTKPIIMLDLDDTLCDLSNQLQKALLIETKKNIPVSKWHNYNLGNIYQMNGKVVEETIKKHNLFQTIKPFEKVNSAIKTLKNLGYDLVIVTARKNIDTKGDITKRWLKEYDIKYDELIVTTHALGKASIAQSIKPTWSIDDNTQYSNDCHEFVENTIIQSRPWNLHKANNPLNFKRVNHFFEFADIVSGK